MALKKSELYSSLWQSCDELRGGMDASQYKDYVLVLLFIKYVSDKYAGMPYAPITIPEGASFKDMVGLKGTTVPQCRERPLDGRFLPFQLLDDAGKAVCHSLIPPVCVSGLTGNHIAWPEGWTDLTS